LTSLPPELGNLSNLRQIDVNGNTDLAFPPPDVVANGTAAILEFLQHLSQE
jgi:Leucine-rich repeat (LRR) protein